MAEKQARPHRAVLKHAPLAPAVFADLSILVERFEVGPGHGLAEFKEAWQQMEFGRIFSTQKLAGRVPGTDETHEEYIVLLLRAATAHLCPKRYPEFEHRLGGIFLVWMLHATQPLEPKVPVRIDAVDWANLEALAREVIVVLGTRLAAGFRARACARGRSSPRLHAALEAALF